MNYPYNLLHPDDLQRYIEDFRKESPEEQEKIRGYHKQMYRLFRDAASLVSADVH